MFYKLPLHVHHFDCQKLHSKKKNDRKAFKFVKIYIFHSFLLKKFFSNFLDHFWYNNVIIIVYNISIIVFCLTSLLFISKFRNENGNHKNQIESHIYSLCI